MVVAGHVEETAAADSLVHWLRTFPGAGGRVPPHRQGCTMRDKNRRESKRQRKFRGRYSQTLAPKAPQQPETEANPPPLRSERELAFSVLWQTICASAAGGADPAVLACEKWRRKAHGERNDFWSRIVALFQQSNADWWRLTAAIRSGVPMALRGTVWYKCSGAEARRLRASRTYYEELAAGLASRSEAVAVIDMDVPRTGVEDAELGPLRHVLVAFASRNPEIGYCQSMNYVAACLLHYTDEERAFWMLCSIIEDLLPPHYYTATMSGLRVDLKLLETLVAQYLPGLHAHLAEKGIDIAPIAMNWFLCLFVNTLPQEQAHRVMDCLLHEGPKVLFRAALGILRAREAELMGIDGVADAFLLLRSPFGSDGRPGSPNARLAPAATDDLLSHMYGSWLAGLKTDVLEQLRRQFSGVVFEEDAKQAARRQACSPGGSSTCTYSGGSTDSSASNGSSTAKSWVSHGGNSPQDLLAKAVVLIESLPSSEAGDLLGCRGSPVCH